jgi:sugar phosphate permease
MILSIGSFGFFQFIFFPALITIFSYSYSEKEKGKIVGLWSSKSNFGNILGFLLANLLVH